MFNCQHFILFRSSMSSMLDKRNVRKVVGNDCNVVPIIIIILYNFI